MSPKTAYITGGAGGIGFAVAQALNQRGMRIVVADINLSAAQEAVKKLQETSASGEQQHLAVEVDVSSWESQVAAFEKAIEAVGRLDVVIVNAGVGEKAFVPNDPRAQGFVKPNLDVLEVDLNGFFYTSALAIQQMRRQEPGEDGLRGRIVGTASVCGFYCVPTLPVYTAAKHGVVGFVRSYGKYLREEQMTLNAVCPHVARTSISTSDFYDSLQEKGLLTPMQGIVDAFMQFIDRGDQSGECLEIGPVDGVKLREAPAVLNKESEILNGLLYERGHPLHEARS